MPFVYLDPIIPFIDPMLLLVAIIGATVIGAWCAMLSEDPLAIFISGCAFICYVFLFNLFYRLIFQLDIMVVTVLTLGEIGIIGFFMLIKLYWALTGGWHKLKKGQFKVKQS
ncbi:MAG: hypothetical protein ACTSR3_09860 [Candidatus Helarchaeota archaeon]